MMNDEGKTGSADARKLQSVSICEIAHTWTSVFRGNSWKFVEFVGMLL